MKILLDAKIGSRCFAWYFGPQVDYQCLACQETKFNTSLPNDIIFRFQETHQSFDIKMTSFQRPTRHKHSNTRIYPRLPLGPRAKPPGLSRVPCISWSRAKCTVTKRLIAWRVSQLGGRWSGVCLFMTKMMAIDSDPTLNTRHHFFFGRGWKLISVGFTIGYCHGKVNAIIEVGCFEC